MSLESPPITFGRYISQQRKKRNLSQKELAALIRKPDEDKSITPQYLNDIEHDRRSPSSPELIREIADALKVEPDVLAALAGRLPSDLSKHDLSDPEAISRAMKAFRKALESHH